MAKMAAKPIYGKKPFKNLLHRNPWVDSTKLGMQHLGLLTIIVDSNDDPGVTLTYFEARAKFRNLGFSLGKWENNGYLRTNCSHWPENL